MKKETKFPCIILTLLDGREWHIWTANFEQAKRYIKDIYVAILASDQFINLQHRRGFPLFIARKDQIGTISYGLRSKETTK